MQSFLQFATAASQLALVWHLWRKGLLRRFPYLALFMALHSLWAVEASLIKPSAPLADELWQFFAVATMVSLVAVFLETVALSLEHYPGLSRQALLGAFGIVGALSLVVGALEPTGMVRSLLVAQRVLGVAVAVSAIGLLLVLNYFDPRRKPNVIRHERVMAGMAAATAMAAWLLNHGWPEAGTAVLYLGSIGFPLLWIWALRAEGEIDSRPPSTEAGWTQARAAADQLRKYYE